MLGFKKYLWLFTILFVFFFSTMAESAPPQAARIFGTVTVDGTALTQDTDEGYELEVTREDGTSYDPAAELTDGLNYFSGYGIYVPLYDADDQPGGANPGDTAVMHVYKDGLELAVTSPASGEFTVGGSLSNHRMDLSVVSLEPTQYQLSATVTGGHGTISPTSGTYDEGTVVTLTAIPETGYRVEEWSGTDNDGSKVNTNTVTMNSNRSVTVQFEEIPATQYQLSASVTGGHGTISPTSGTYSEGTVVTLTAIPESGYRVEAWNGTNNNSSTANTNTVTMNSNRSVTVQFEEIPATQYQLSASVTGGHGTISPTSGTYSEGTVVTLTATPETGYRVQGWSGTNNDSSTANTNTVTMNSNRSVTVQFAQTAPVINLFSATPSTISEGEFVTLSWNITGATSATINNGVGTVVTTSGTAQDAPTITTTYTLTASNPAGTVTRGVTVTVVQGGPIIESFSATPETINENGSATLSWSISDADSATIDNDIGPVDPVSGSLEVSPLSTTTYTLTATNDDGSITRTATVTVSEPSVPEIVETIPHHGAGINDSTRVSNMTSFSVRIEDSDGIDITDPESIRFTIDDGVVEEYTRDLGDDSVVRVIKLTDDDDTQVTKLWVAYDRSKEDELEDYSYDTQINIKVDVNNSAGLEMAQENYSIKTETEAEHDEAEAASPKTEPVDVSDPDLEDPEYTYNAGIKITSGKLKGAKIIYNSNESVKPRFGPTKEVPSLDAESEEIPMNLQPPNVFSTPVKLIIPYRGHSNVTDIGIFLFTGNRWVRACNADGNVEADGEGWMVPESRVNHNKGKPSTVEIKVYHFSAVQAGSDGPPDSCFITTSGYGSFSETFCVKKLERFADMYKMSYLALQTACVQRMLVFSFILALMAEGFIIFRRSKKYSDYS
jgi:acetolactate synthase regulatory subunit